MSSQVSHSVCEVHQDAHAPSFRATLWAGGRVAVQERSSIRHFITDRFIIVSHNENVYFADIYLRGKFRNWTQRDSQRGFNGQRSFRHNTKSR